MIASDNYSSLWEFWLECLSAWLTPPASAALGTDLWDLLQQQVLDLYAGEAWRVSLRQNIVWRIKHGEL